MSKIVLGKLAQEFTETFNETVKRKRNSKPNKYDKFIFEGIQTKNKQLIEENIKACIKQMGTCLQNKEYGIISNLGHISLMLFASLRQKDLNRRDILCLQGSMFMLLCKSEIENTNYSPVIKYAPTLIDIAHKIDDHEFTIDVNNIIAQAFIMAKDYRNAAVSWQRNLNVTKNQVEKAFFFHEIGRCYYQMTEFAEARLFGLWSLTEAFAARNNWWCLNAALLVAQSETMMGCHQEALESFNDAEKYAYKEKNQDIINFIQSQKVMIIKADCKNK